MFALVAAALASLWFLPSVWARADVYGAFLFLVAPVLAGGLAGWLIGAPLFDPPEGYGPGHAVLTGAAVASLALFLFAPLFAMVFLAGPDNPPAGLVRGASVALLALVVLGPVVLLVGASTGLFLHRYGRTSSRGGPASPDAAAIPGE